MSNKNNPYTHHSDNFVPTINKDNVDIEFAIKELERKAGTIAIIQGDPTLVKDKVLREDQILPFDVDKTLILYKDVDENGPEKIMIEYGGTKKYFTPSKKHIELLKHHKERGYHIRVWSANGYKWAEKVVLELGILDYVDSIETKPKEYVDDKDIKEWCNYRIFLENE